METTANAFAQLRKESQSIFNRIHSIAEDAAFVREVHAHYPDLPLLPNMRCGAWYSDPKIASAERAYFKSTDGHTNNWCFNLRRPNLHTIPLIAKHAGFVLVDSTRAGKRIPDALSKTVPIWCSIVNRAILKRIAKTDLEAWDIALYTPPGSVSPQEHSQIEDKLDAWASQLAASSYSLPTLDRPLRPIWITPATTSFPTFPKPPDRAFYPLICVSASKQVTKGLERRASGYAYIQGSGDDHELWGMGLTPVLYWRHRDELLTARSSDLPDLVRSLVSASSHTDPVMNPDQPLCGTPIQRISGRISICNIASLRRPDLLQLHPSVAFLCLAPQDTNHLTGVVVASSNAFRVLSIQTPEGKKGQHHFLTVVLPRSMPFIHTHLQNLRTVCIACNTGTDMSIGVAVAALAVFFRVDGSLCSQGNARDQLKTNAIGVAKDVLKTRLEWIIASCPQANPSRTTLKRVNDFLLSPFADPLTLGISSRPDGTPGLDERDSSPMIHESR
ncbi:initiator tRNA phosphoribosyl transferase [Boletus coccyginus]|nr:initiator tRNA phosphoribosyl transferase [Boletus coccyginus]